MHMSSQYAAMSGGLLRGSYVCAGGRGGPDRKDGAVTAPAGRRDRRAAPRLRTAECQSEPCCLKSALGTEKEAKRRNDE